MGGQGKGWADRGRGGRTGEGVGGQRGREGRGECVWVPWSWWPY